VVVVGVIELGYSVPRFFLDFLRARDLPFVDGRIAGLTPAQWITPVLALVGIRLIVRGVSPAAQSFRGAR